MGFRIGEHIISYYGFFIALGIILAGICGIYQVKLFKKNVNDFILAAALAALGGILGAKLLYLIVFRQQIDFSRITELNYFNSIMSGGFVFYGGFIGGLLTLFLCGRKIRINVCEYINVCMPCLPLAHGFGRLGCNAVGCCYGIPYDGVFARVYQHSLVAPNNLPLFPVQLLEAIADIVIAIILLLYIDTKRSKPKYSLPVYLLMYAPIRFILEYFRNDFRGEICVFSISQWISIILICVSVFCFCKRNILH